MSRWPVSMVGFVNEPLESRTLLSAHGLSDDPIGQVPDDGAGRVPATAVILQLKQALASKPASAGLARVLSSPGFTGFWHS